MGLFDGLFVEGVVHWPTLFSVALFPVIVLTYALLSGSWSIIPGFERSASSFLGDRCAGVRDDETIVRRVRLYGLAGLVGALAFTLSFAVLHLVRPEVAWRQDYVSRFVRGRLGWLFISATIVHGFGNLAIGLGLGGSLLPGRLRAWAVLLFGIAATGIVLAAVLPVDPTGASPTVVGRAHQGIVYLAFLGELVALLLFSIAFARDPRWRWSSGVSSLLVAVTAVALTGFLVAALLNRMPGLAERLSLASFMVWEFWVAFHLVRMHD